MPLCRASGLERVASARSESELSPDSPNYRWMSHHFRAGASVGNYYLLFVSLFVTICYLYDEGSAPRRRLVLYEASQRGRYRPTRPRAAGTSGHQSLEFVRVCNKPVYCEVVLEPSRTPFPSSAPSAVSFLIGTSSTVGRLVLNS